MRGLAKIACDLGDGDIRLTVWQNLLISGVRDDAVALATAAIEALGLGVKASNIRAGLIACTGNAGCKFAASDTKRHAAAIGDWCEPRVDMDTPLNIHLTGCHHSCAQHYISDIGLIGAKVPVGSDDDTVEGYHLFTGGGFGPDADVGQEVFHDVKAEDVPQTVERLLKAYLTNRASSDETFCPLPAVMAARPCANSPMQRYPHEPDDTASQGRDHSVLAPFSSAAPWLNGFLRVFNDGRFGAAVGGAGRRRAWRGRRQR